MQVDGGRRLRDAAMEGARVRDVVAVFADEVLLSGWQVDQVKVRSGQAKQGKAKYQQLQQQVRQSMSTWDGIGLAAVAGLLGLDPDPLRRATVPR